MLKNGARFRYTRSHDYQTPTRHALLGSGRPPKTAIMPLKGFRQHRWLAGACVLMYAARSGDGAVGTELSGVRRLYWPTCYMLRRTLSMHSRNAQRQQHLRYVSINFSLRDVTVFVYHEKIFCSVLSSACSLLRFTDSLQISVICWHSCGFKAE